MAERIALVLLYSTFRARLGPQLSRVMWRYGRLLYLGLSAWEITGGALVVDAPHCSSAHPRYDNRCRYDAISESALNVTPAIAHMSRYPCPKQQQTLNSVQTLRSGVLRPRVLRAGYLKQTSIVALFLIRYVHLTLNRWVYDGGGQS